MSPPKPWIPTNGSAARPARARTRRRRACRRAARRRRARPRASSRGAGRRRARPRARCAPGRQRAAAASVRRPRARVTRRARAYPTPGRRRARAARCRRGSSRARAADTPRRDSATVRFGIAATSSSPSGGTTKPSKSRAERGHVLAGDVDDVQDVIDDRLDRRAAEVAAREDDADAAAAVGDRADLLVVDVAPVLVHAEHAGVRDHRRQRRELERLEEAAPVDVREVDDHAAALALAHDVAPEAGEPLGGVGAAALRAAAERVRPRSGAGPR